MNLYRLWFEGVGWEGRGTVVSPSMGHPPCAVTALHEKQSRLCFDGRVWSSGHSIGFHSSEGDPGFVICTQGQALIHSWALSWDLIFDYLLSRLKDKYKLCNLVSRWVKLWAGSVSGQPSLFDTELIWNHVWHLYPCAQWLFCRNCLTT